jgi:protease II
MLCDSISHSNFDAVSCVCVLMQEEEGFSVHVGATRDARYLTITAASKTCTEVHIMDAGCPESGPVLVHRRTPGMRPPPTARTYFAVTCGIIQFPIHQ